MSFKRKTLPGIVAVSLVALMVTGTFAWTNFGSRITNEWRGIGSIINPPDNVGGTLHNDHAPDSSYHQIFVENWGDEPIFVRIMLREYMEMGSGAGLKSTDGDEPNPLNFAEPLIPNTYIDNPDAWKIHIPISTSPNICDSEIIHSYWEWEMGGQKYFHPASVDRRNDKSYVASGSPADLTANYENVQQTLYAQVITMAQWIENGSIAGNYWVFDTDGWAYWAAPLNPGDATGLLLNRVTKITPPEKDYFYGINVIAQMATADLDDLDNYERFGDSSNGGWTEAGEELMKAIVGSLDIEVKSIDYINISYRVIAPSIREYVVDFNERSFTIIDWPDFPERETTEFDLCGDEIEEFFRASARYGLESWNGKTLHHPEIQGGLSWYLEVVYSDSTTMSARGQNVFPDTWDYWHNALMDLTR